MIRFETDRTLVKDLEKSDFADLFQIYNSKDNMQYISGGKYDWTAIELEKKLNAHTQNYPLGYGIFGIWLKEDRRLIGEAGLFNSYSNRQILELGYIIDSRYWNKGYGTEICNGLINYGFERLGLKKIKARMNSLNKASKKLSEKCGMTLVNSGKEKGIDYLEFELTRVKTVHHREF